MHPFLILFVAPPPPGWDTDDSERMPWNVLDGIGAPTGDPDFATWSRGQLLRIVGMVTRRYEVKFGGWPFKLHRVGSSQYSLDERRATAAEALGLKRCCRDTFTHGICLRWPSIDQLMTREAAFTVRSSLGAMTLSTDHSERQNAEIAASRPHRAGARDAAHFSRETLLKQARATHLHAGGLDPLRPSDLRCSLRSCEAVVNPLLIDNSAIRVGPIFFGVCDVCLRPF